MDSRKSRRRPHSVRETTKRTLNFTVPRASIDKGKSPERSPSPVARRRHDEKADRDVSSFSSFSSPLTSDDESNRKEEAGIDDDNNDVPPRKRRRGFDSPGSRDDDFSNERLSLHGSDVDEGDAPWHPDAEFREFGSEQESGRDLEDEDAETTVRVQPRDGGSARREQMDVHDVALTAIEEIVAGERKEAGADRASKRVLDDFLTELRLAFREQIDAAEEHRVLWRAVRRASATKRRLRKELLEVEKSRLRVSRELSDAKAERARRDAAKKCTEEANAFLVGIEALRQAASAKPANASAFADGDNIDALLHSTFALFASVRHIGSTNRALEQLLASMGSALSEHK
eukprot:Opistho-1_new@79665